MANPLAFGFMPMEQALAMNQGFSGATPSSYDVMQSVLDAQRAQSRNQFANSPFGDSFLRRFGGLAPEMGGGMGAAPSTPMADPNLMNNLMGAVYANQGNSSNFMEGLAPGGGNLLQHSGPMQQQPWYDEYVAAHQAGMETPTLQNMRAGTPVNKEKQAAYREQRQATEDSRWDAVRNKAVAKSEQRAARMGDISPNQQFLNEIGRFSDARGGEGGNSFLDAALYGPEYAAAMAAVNQRGQEAQSRLDMLKDPTAIWANALANGQQIPLASIQGEMANPQGFALGQFGGATQDFNQFATAAGQLGFDREMAKQKWIEMGHPDPDAPGFWSRLFSGEVRLPSWLIGEDLNKNIPSERVF